MLWDLNEETIISDPGLIYSFEDRQSPFVFNVKAQFMMPVLW